MGEQEDGAGDGQFFEQMDQQLAGWDDPMLRLREALAENELVLYCQPILSLQGGAQFPMAEMLVRMREEEAALLPPGDFFPVFEHYHMLPELDRWVVGSVVKRLLEGSRIPRLSINVSGQSLEDAGFAKFVAGALVSAAVPASSLVFEIDESDVLFRLDAAARFAAAVKAVGCGVMIDGFGGRAVTFSPLKVLRCDYLKVDGRIVRGILRSGVAQTKLSAILRVAETIGIGVVAECVEDQDILVRLKALGVHYAQGFGIYQPHRMDVLLGATKQPAERT